MRKMRLRNLLSPSPNVEKSPAPRNSYMGILMAEKLGGKKRKKTGTTSADFITQNSRSSNA